MKQIISFAIAVGFSFLLFALMNLLIDNNAKAFDGQQTPPISIDVNIKDEPLEITKRTAKKPKPLELKKQPKVTKTQPQKPQMKPLKVAMAVGAVPGFKSSLTSDKLFDGLVGADSAGFDGNSESTPRVRIEPMYSQKALQAGKEGYVTLSFDIDQQGDTTNIKVVEASPRGYFESSAKKALRKWKYNPKREDGKAVAVFNQSITLEFKLDGSLD